MAQSVWWLVYELDHRGIVVWFLGTVTKFPFSGASRPFLGLTQLYCSVGTGVYFLGGMDLVLHLRLVSRLRMSGAMLPRLYVLIVCIGRTSQVKWLFSIVLKTHTPHYLRTTFRKLLLFPQVKTWSLRSNRHIPYILNESFLHLWDSSIHTLNMK